MCVRVCVSEVARNITFISTQQHSHKTGDYVLWRAANRAYVWNRVISASKRSTWVLWSGCMAPLGRVINCFFGMFFFERGWYCVCSRFYLNAAWVCIYETRCNKITEGNSRRHCVGDACCALIYMRVTSLKLLTEPSLMSNRAETDRSNPGLWEPCLRWMSGLACVVVSRIRSGLENIFCIKSTSCCCCSSTVPGSKSSHFIDVHINWKHALWPSGKWFFEE